MICPEFRLEKRNWMFWLIRIFGKKYKYVGMDMGSGDYNVKITGYFWRDKFWITKEEIDKKSN